jgi:hypothetical protein
MRTGPGAAGGRPREDAPARTILRGAAASLAVACGYAVVVLGLRWALAALL